MPFYKAGDRSVTAPKIPVKKNHLGSSLKQRYFLHLFATMACKSYLDKKNV